MIRFFFKKKSTHLPKSFTTFLKTTLGIVPSDQSWYKEAISHSSYKNISGNKTDNERLEFLGDAFISMAVADYLFRKYPEEQEGYLTKVRAKIVSREQLNRFGKAIALDDHILYQKGKNTYKSLVGNAFEALFGAVLVDKGYEKTKKCFEKYILDIHLDINQILIENRDYKSELLIFFQKKKEKSLSKQIKKKIKKKGIVLHHM
jgi:ribonuclease-3